MTLNELKEQKQKLGFSNEMLSILTGLSENELKQIFEENSSAPDYNTMMLLSSVLDPQLRGVRETSPEFIRKLQIPGAFPFSAARQGQYTVEDYYRLPDDIRVELIDGVFYYMACPTRLHQFIGGFVYTKMMNFILSRKGPCLPFIAPVDVRLDCNEKTMVQPDVLIICDPSKSRDGHIYGAPDFVMEVLSPSTRRKDLTIKLQKYRNAGVREHWIVDPEKKQILSYRFGQEPELTVYGFTDITPIAIWNGELEIDFKELQEYCDQFRPLLE